MTAVRPHDFDDLVQSMLTPNRRAAPMRPFPARQAQSQWIDGPQDRLHVRVAGEGPSVLLVHGWGGRSEDLGAVAASLVERGHRVIAIDLPAHGESGGRRTSIPAAARALSTLSSHYGALRAVVAHSMGAAIAVEAMAMGMPVERAVLVAAPTRILAHTRAKAAGFGLHPGQIDALIEAFRRQGIDLGALAISRNPIPLPQPALFVHSRDDSRVPLADGVAGAAAWPGARLLEVDGLGHRRVLDDAQVLDSILAFVRAAARVAPTPAIQA